MYRRGYRYTTRARKPHKKGMLRYPARVRCMLTCPMPSREIWSIGLPRCPPSARSTSTCRKAKIRKLKSTLQCGKWSISLFLLVVFYCVYSLKFHSQLFFTVADLSSKAVISKAVTPSELRGHRSRIRSVRSSIHACQITMLPMASPIPIGENIACSYSKSSWRLQFSVCVRRTDS